MDYRQELEKAGYKILSEEPIGEPQQEQAPEIQAPQIQKPIDYKQQLEKAGFKILSEEALSPDEAKKYLPEARTTEHGVFGGLASAVGRGAIGIPEIYARAVRAYDKPGGIDIARNIATPIIKGTEALKGIEFLKPTKDVKGVRRWIEQGLETVLPSLATALPGAALGALAGGPVGAAVVGAGTAAGIMGSAEYDRALEEAYKANRLKGLSEKDAVSKAQDYAKTSALYEAIPEAAATLLELPTLGASKALIQPIKASIKQALKTGGKEGVKKLTSETIQGLLSPAFRQTLTDIAKTIPMEMVTEGITAYGQIKTSNEAGLTNINPAEGVLDVMGPTIAASIFFGSGIKYINRRDRQSTFNALTNEKAEPKQRLNAAEQVYSGLKEISPVHAEEWLSQANSRIQANQSIRLDAKLSQYASKTKIETPEQMTDVINNVQQEAGNIAETITQDEETGNVFQRIEQVREQLRTDKEHTDLSDDEVNELANRVVREEINKKIKTKPIAMPQETITSSTKQAEPIKPVEPAIQETPFTQRLSASQREQLRLPQQEITKIEETAEPIELSETKRVPTRKEKIRELDIQETNRQQQKEIKSIDNFINLLKEELSIVKNNSDKITITNQIEDLETRKTNLLSLPETPKETIAPVREQILQQEPAIQETPFTEKLAIPQREQLRLPTKTMETTKTTEPMKTIAASKPIETIPKALKMPTEKKAAKLPELPAQKPAAEKLTKLVPEKIKEITEEKPTKAKFTPADKKFGSYLIDEIDKIDKAYQKKYPYSTMVLTKNELIKQWEADVKTSGISIANANMENELVNVSGKNFEKIRFEYKSKPTVKAEPEIKTETKPAEVVLPTKIKKEPEIKKVKTEAKPEIKEAKPKIEAKEKTAIEKTEPVQKTEKEDYGNYLINEIDKANKEKFSNPNVYLSKEKLINKWKERSRYFDIDNANAEMENELIKVSGKNLDKIKKDYNSQFEAKEAKPKKEEVKPTIKSEIQPKIEEIKPKAKETQQSQKREKIKPKADKLISKLDIENKLEEHENQILDMLEVKSKRKNDQDILDDYINLSNNLYGNETEDIGFLSKADVLKLEKKGLVVPKRLIISMPIFKDKILNVFNKNDIGLDDIYKNEYKDKEGRTLDYDELPSDFQSFVDYLTSVLDEDAVIDLKDYLPVLDAGLEAHGLTKKEGKTTRVSARFGLNANFAGIIKLVFQNGLSLKQFETAGFHDNLHYALDLLTNIQEREKLLDMFPSQRRGKKKIISEELMADDYAEYGYNRRHDLPFRDKTKGIWERIYDFLGKIKNLLSGAGFKTYEDVKLDFYDKIYTGELARKQNLKDFLTEGIIDKKKAGKRRKEIISYYDTIRYGRKQGIAFTKDNIWQDAKENYNHMRQQNPVTNQITFGNIIPYAVKNLKDFFGTDIADNGDMKWYEHFLLPLQKGMKHQKYNEHLNIEVNGSEMRHNLSFALYHRDPTYQEVADYKDVSLNEVKEKAKEYNKLIAQFRKANDKQSVEIHKTERDIYLLRGSKDVTFKNHLFDLSDVDADKLGKVMFESTENNVVYNQKDLEQAYKRLNNNEDISDKQKSAYYGWKKATDSTLSLMVEDAKKKTFYPYRDKPYFDVLREIYDSDKLLSKTKKLNDRILKGDPLAEKKLQNFLKTEVSHLIKDKKEMFSFLRAFNKIDPSMDSIRNARQETTKRKYYFHLLREGDYVVRVREVSTGLEEEVKRYTTKFEANADYQRITRKYGNDPKYIVDKPTQEAGMTDDILQDIKDVTAQKFVDTGLLAVLDKTFKPYEDVNFYDQLRNVFYDYDMYQDLNYLINQKKVPDNELINYLASNNKTKMSLSDMPKFKEIFNEVYSTVDNTDMLRENMINKLTEKLKTRGFARTQIGRKAGASGTIKGYKTDEVKKQALQYFQNFASFMSKHERAFEHYQSLLWDRDEIKNKPQLYSDLRSYVTDMLRQRSQWDKAVTGLKQFAYVTFLVGNPKSALVNLTGMFTSGIPYLARILKNYGKSTFSLNAEKYYLKSAKDIFSKKLTDEEKSALNDAYVNGLLLDQYNREMRGSITDNKAFQWYNKAFNALNWITSQSEIAMRKTAFIASYRVYRDNGASIKDAVKGSNEHLNIAYGLYGKHNKPSISTKGTISSSLADASLTFTSYVHNYLANLMFSLKDSPLGKGGFDVMIRSFAYMALFGGLTAVPFVDDLLDELEKLTKTPLRANMRKLLGNDSLANVTMDGLPSLLDMDISGSLKIGAPLLGKNENIMTNITGVYGGMYNRYGFAYEAFTRGQYMKGIEESSPLFISNMLKGYRMAGEKVTSKSGKIIKDENGKPIVISSDEALTLGLGFQLSKISQVRKIYDSLNNVETEYNDLRNDIYTMARLADSKDEKDDVIKEMVKFNKEINEINKKHKGLISPITYKSLYKQLTQ